MGRLSELPNPVDDIRDILAEFSDEDAASIIIEVISANVDGPPLDRIVTKITEMRNWLRDSEAVARAANWRVTPT